MRENGRIRHYLKPVLSGLMVVLGIGLFSIHEEIIDSILDEVLLFKPNSFIYNQWKDPKVPITINFNYFNWSNPEDLMNTSIKPKFEEIGPLVFYQEIHRWNVTFNENNTITYRNYKLFHLDEDKSKLRFQDNITTLNVVPLIASDRARNWNFFMRKGLSIALYDTPYHMMKKAKQWLFEGFEDAFLETANYLPFIEDIPKIDKFAWFYQRNDSSTYEGVYNIGTGMGNTTIGKTYHWNYRNRSDYDGHCGELQANAEIYPQRIQKDKIGLFFPDLCRKIVLDYNETIVWNGIEAYRFSAGVNYLDNGKYHPENKCLCNKRCLKFGVLDYSKCKFGIPAYLSFPHFTHADPKYRDDIEGMRPDQDKYKLEILLNPRTGIILEMDLSFQMNILLEPNPSITKYNNVPEVMFPIFWFQIKAMLDRNQSLLLIFVEHLAVISKFISSIIIILGTVLHIRFLYEYSKAKKTKKTKLSNCHLENMGLIIHKDFPDKP